MKAAGKTYEPVTYERAGHGSMRAGEQPDANEANKKARRGLDAPENLDEEELMMIEIRGEYRYHRVFSWTLVPLSLE